MNHVFALISRVTTRHPWKVLAAWGLVVAGAAPFAMQFEDRLSGAGNGSEGARMTGARLWERR